MAVSEKVILRLNDLVSWITDQVDWMTGLQTQTSITSQLNINQSNENGNTLNMNNINDKNITNNNSNANNLISKMNNIKYQQSLHPISINSGLDFSDVIHEKQLIGE